VYPHQAERLSEALERAGLDALVATSPENIAYITGFRSLTGAVFPTLQFAIFTRQGAALVVPAIEAPAIIADAVDVDHVVCFGGSGAPLPEPATPLARRLHAVVATAAVNPVEALAGALERLRTVREPSDGRPTAMLLAAADPANPYGAALPWPRRGDDDRRALSRSAGAYVVLIDGVPVVYVDRGGGSLQMLPAAADRQVAVQALAALRALVDDGRVRELVVTRVDGEPVGQSAWRDSLVEAGFAAAYRGLALRARSNRG